MKVDCGLKNDGRKRKSSGEKDTKRSYQEKKKRVEKKLRGGGHPQGKDQATPFFAGATGL